MASVFAIRSSTPKMLRMASDWPMAAPNQVLSLGKTSTLRPAGRSDSSTSPTLSTAPGWTTASDTRAAPTLVPLVDDRSRMWMPALTRVSSQWWRDTVSSGSTRSLSVALPIVSLSPSGFTVPLALPESTMIWMPTREPDGPTARVSASIGGCSARPASPGGGARPASLASAVSCGSLIGPPARLAPRRPARATGRWTWILPPA